MKKYASDLNSTDQIIDKHTGEVVIIDYLEPLDNDKIRVYGYTEFDGTDWTRDLDADSMVKILEG